MIEAFKRAVSGASRRRQFFFYIVVFLVMTSLFRGNAWKAIVAKIAFVAIGVLFVFLFELYKGWRVVSGKPQLDSGQLWKRLFIVVGVMSAIYISLAVYLAVFAGNPNGLALLFPFYFCFLFSSALPFFWEFRELRTI
jgi:hypothetical protein